MTPDWLAEGRNLMGIVATAIAATVPGRVALIAVAQTLSDMMRLGIAQDLREYRDHRREKNRLERANLAADELVKRAVAVKTVAEAVQIANHSNFAPGGAGAPRDIRQAAAELQAALAALGAFGGELAVDSGNLEALSSLPTDDTRVVSLQQSPGAISLSAGLVSGSLETVEDANAPASPKAPSGQETGRE
jgi:hypothetical protein